MNAKFSIITAVSFLLAFTIGCGSSNQTVTGKVTFPDGTPLTEGEVLFETALLMSRGSIQKDGTYSVSSGELKGMPKGTYQVSLGGFTFERMVSPASEGKPPVFESIAIPVDKKYLNSSTSNLTCEVKGRTVYNITVEPPAR